MRKSRSDGSDDDVDDEFINKLLIITQTPPSSRKHPSGDRTGDYVPRAKVSAEMARVINDGLQFYEQDISSKLSATVISLGSLHAHLEV